MLRLNYTYLLDFLQAKGDEELTEQEYVKCMSLLRENCEEIDQEERQPSGEKKRRKRMEKHKSSGKKKKRTDLDPFTTQSCDQREAQCSSSVDIHFQPIANPTEKIESAPEKQIEALKESQSGFAKEFQFSADAQMQFSSLSQPPVPCIEQTSLTQKTAPTQQQSPSNQIILQALCQMEDMPTFSFEGSCSNLHSQSFLASSEPRDLPIFSFGGE